MTKIGILVFSYNAASTLAQVLDRIPDEMHDSIHEILVGDDHSQDSTYLVGLGYQQQKDHLPITVVRHAENLGYGGHQKWGYRYAIDTGWDVVVQLPGTGPYAPAMLPARADTHAPASADPAVGSSHRTPGEAHHRET